ncbi:TetR/AcrR family transcriptional regulator [Planococcus faecalis]|uniref:TetR/AcrR family transcriptional regulator n=1 Tax=Planococcus faecalis TaxID=1598147 RepID=UPI00210E7AF8|nr:TetR/AcrR family transcriptional regulator [Planococcus faecalis]
MNKRTEIMNQAVHLFSLKGFHQTSVQEVAEAVGISKGAFYKHFDSKENMFIEILKQYHEEITTEISESQHAPGSNNKDVFKKKLAIEIERTLSNQEFFHDDFQRFHTDRKRTIKIGVHGVKAVDDDFTQNHFNRHVWCRNRTLFA